MELIKNTTGSKAVRISTDAEGNVRAAYIQFYNDGLGMQEQLLEFKSFARVTTAQKWAAKILN